MARGGYQKPSSPAPVSGPGRLSKRTDGKQPVRSPGGMAYGENQDFVDIQSAAPMAANRPPQTQGQRAASQPGAPLPTPLGAPTQRPDEPVTSGNPRGPGVGPEALRFGSSPSGPMSRDMQTIKNYLPDLEVAMSFKGAPDTFRALVNYLRNA